MRRYRKATIKDVAAHAGVSTTTVSLFASGKEDVCSTETATRIRAAIAELHYTPNSLSRSLRVRATRTIGVCAGHTATISETDRSTFVERVWRGISIAADDAGYSLLHYPRTIRNAPSCDAFLDGRVDGILFSSPHNDPRPAAIAVAGLPVVVLTRSIELPPECGAVYADERDTVDLALSHLWDRGHRRIAHLTGPVSSAEIAAMRRQAYVAWMMGRSAFDPALVSDERSWDDDPSESIAIWHARSSRPTAIFSANDALAFRAIDVARARGWRVPEELSIVGVDNTQRAAFSDPPLTSVDIPAEAIGEAAIQTLLRLIAGAPVETCRITLPVMRLVVRGSTASVTY